MLAAEAGQMPQGSVQVVEELERFPGSTSLTLTTDDSRVIAMEDLQKWLRLKRWNQSHRQSQAKGRALHGSNPGFFPS
jgi:hypothetical protein